MAYYKVRIVCVSYKEFGGYYRTQKSSTDKFIIYRIANKYYTFFFCLSFAWHGDNKLWLEEICVFFWTLLNFYLLWLSIFNICQPHLLLLKLAKSLSFWM